MRHAIGVLLLALLAAAPRPAAAGEVTIVQKGRTFSPAEPTVRVGDTLVFVNADTVKHNVHSPTEGFVFDLEVQRPGQSDRWTVPTAGTFDVLCHIHPRMKMRVRATP